MNLEHFENKLNKKFEDFHPSVSDDLIWDKIEDQLPKEEKRRRFLWLFFGALLGLIVLSTVAYQKINMQTKPVEGEIFKSVQTEQKSLIVENAIKEESTVKEDEAIDAQTETVVPLTSDSQLGILEDRISKIEESLQAIQAEESMIKEHSDIIASIGNQKLELRNHQIIIENDYNNVSLINPLQYIGLIPLVKLEELFRDKPLVNFESLKKETEVFEQLGALHFDLAYYQSAIVHQSKVTQNELLTLRSEAESSFEALQLGMMYEYPLSKRLSLIGGLRYMLNNWESTHVLCEEETSEEQGLRYIQITKTTISRIGKDHVVSIPLLINYSKPLGQKFEVDLALGYEHSFYATHSGFEIDLEGIEYDIDKDEEDRYNGHMGSYALARFGFRYSLSAQTDFRFGLETKLGLNDFQNDNVLVNKKYNYYGLNVGVIRQF